MELDKIELLIGALGTAGTFAVAEAISKGARSVYTPLIHFAEQYVTGTRFDMAFLGSVRKEMIITSEHVAEVASQAIKILQISQNIAISSAFWVGAIETGVNFFRSWKGQGNRPFVVDILEGGIRGSLVGFAISLQKRQSEYHGMQIATGIAIGYTIGMIGAFIGSVGGYAAHVLQNPPIREIDQHFRDLNGLR